VPGSDAVDAERCGDRFADLQDRDSAVHILKLCAAGYLTRLMPRHERLNANRARERRARSDDVVGVHLGDGVRVVTQFGQALKGFRRTWWRRAGAGVRVQVRALR